MMRARYLLAMAVVAALFSNETSGLMGTDDSGSSLTGERKHPGKEVGASAETGKAGAKAYEALLNMHRQWIVPRIFPE